MTFKHEYETTSSLNEALWFVSTTDTVPLIIVSESEGHLLSVVEIASAPKNSKRFPLHHPARHESKKLSRCM